MKKAVLLCGVLLLACQFGLWAAGQRGARDGASSRVVVWMAPDETRFMMDSGLPEKFMRENPQYTLEVVQFPWDTLHTRLMAGFAGGDIPAVSQAADHWVGEFAPLGGLMPLDDFRRRNGYTADRFLPNMWEHFRFTDGVIYGAPFIAESRIMFYRRDLLEAAGFSGPPTTWEQIWEYGRRLGNGVDRFALAHQDSWLDFHFFSSILYSNGGEFFNEQRTVCTLDSPAAIEALTFYGRLYEENVIPRDPQRRADTFGGFREGFYAMAHRGAWWFGLLNAVPELQGRWSIAMLPSWRTNTVYGHPNPWVIPVNSRNRNGANLEGAEAWLNFMYQDENAIQFAMIYGGPPPTLSVYRDPRINQNQSIMAFVEAIERGTNSIHNIPYAETISEVIWNGLSDIRDGVRTPAESARNTVTIINGYLSR